MIRIPILLDEVLIHREPVVSTANSALENLDHFIKGIRQDLSSYGDRFCHEHQLRFYLITSNFDTRTPLKTAWCNAQRYRSKVCEKIKNSKLRPHVVVSTIEHTHEIPDKHKTSKVHIATTSEQFIVSVEEYKRTLPETLVDIDLALYTTNLLNLFGEMYYMCSQLEEPRTEEFKKWILEQSELLTSIVNGGGYFNFEPVIVDGESKIYTMSFWLALAHLQTTLSPVIVGYPHFHFAVGLSSMMEPVEAEYILRECVVNVTPLRDVVSEGTRVSINNSSDGKKKRGRPRKNKDVNIPDAVTKPILYVFKNHTARIPMIFLRMVKQSDEIVKVLITSEEYPLELYKFFYRYTPNGNNWTSSENSTYNRAVCINIYTTKKSLKMMHMQQDSNYVISQKINVVDPEKSKRNKYIHYIQSTMKTKGFYANDDGYVYRRIPESRRSYEPFLTIKDFVDGFSKDVELLNVAVTHADTVIRMMSKMSAVEYLSLERQNIEFPGIKINYRMIEFKDFYYCIQTQTIYNEQNEHNCYRYHPEISLENVEEVIMEFPNKSVWMQQLKTSEVCYVEVLSKLYDCLRKRTHKSLVPLLIGDSNTGKSNIILPLRKVFPDHLVGIIDHFGAHYVADQCKGKELVHAEEANGFLNGVTGPNRALILQYLALEAMTSNKKHGDITQLSDYWSGLILAANLHSTDEYLDVKEIFNRCFIIWTKKTDGIMAESDFRERLMREIPKVILYAGLCYKVHNGSYVIPIRIDDNEMNKMLIDERAEWSIDIVTCLAVLNKKNKGEMRIVLPSRYLEILDNKGLMIGTKTLDSQEVVISSIRRVRESLITESRKRLTGYVDNDRGY